jgi:hypothetical protein
MKIIIRSFYLEKIKKVNNSLQYVTLIYDCNMRKTDRQALYYTSRCIILRKFKYLSQKSHPVVISSRNDEAT